jgi:hypothetical protein
MFVRLKDEISNNNHNTYEIINVSVSLRSGLNESQVIFNWIKEVKQEIYYESFVSSAYDLLTIMKMIPSDLCAVVISDRLNHKLIILTK